MLVLKGVLVYLARDIPLFVMYYVYGESDSSLLIVYRLYDNADSVIMYKYYVYIIILYKIVLIGLRIKIDIIIFSIIISLGWNDSHGYCLFQWSL